jgi:DNA-directed RNA polymerase subunit RPC12/RpoP
MIDKPRRPILHLKFAPAAPAAPPAPVAPTATPAATRAKAPMAKARATKAQTAKAQPGAQTWKCRPCGKPFEIAGALADDDSVRCPSCNARLGRAGDFRSEKPDLTKLRARVVVGR